MQRCPQGGKLITSRIPISISVINVSKSQVMYSKPILSHFKVIFALLAHDLTSKTMANLPQGLAEGSQGQGKSWGMRCSVFHSEEPKKISIDGQPNSHLECKKTKCIGIAPFRFIEL